MILSRSIRSSFIFLFFLFVFCFLSYSSFAEECARRFPGTIPESSCASCHGEGKICVPRESYSLSPTEHFVCYECIQPPQQCRDRGWIDIDECRRCEAVAGNSCVFAGKT